MVMNVFDACAKIRSDAAGKKCPGGYSIPKDRECQGRGIFGLSRKKRGKISSDLGRAISPLEDKRVQKASRVAGGLLGAALFVPATAGFGLGLAIKKKNRQLAREARNREKSMTEIRSDAAGKKCPGGYFISKDKECQGKGRIGLSRKKREKLMSTLGKAVKPLSDERVVKAVTAAATVARIGGIAANLSTIKSTIKAKKEKKGKKGEGSVKAGTKSRKALADEGSQNSPKIEDPPSNGR